MVERRWNSYRSPTSPRRRDYWLRLLVKHVKNVASYFLNMSVVHIDEIRMLEVNRHEIVHSLQDHCSAA